jgi:protein Xni
LALTGDNTNGIRGVPGIGPKTATKLIEDFGSLDGILAATETPEGNDGSLALSMKMRDKLVDYAEDARQAQSLVRLQTDLVLSLNLKALRYKL